MLSTHIASFATPIDAELARGALASAGIDSRIEGDTVVGAAQWSLGAASVRLFVSEEDAPNASQHLERHERELGSQRRLREGVDDEVARAYRLALVGNFLFPVVAHAISARRLLRIPRQKMSARSRRRFFIAMTVNATVLGVVAFWLLDGIFIRWR